jgi:hypothetical protein
MERLFPLFIAKKVPGVSPLVQGFTMVGFNALFLFIYAVAITFGVKAIA